ncbi:MAG: site-specific integrase [Cytophagaceae bacterium]|nr:site-specific integrase [Cytophagaceae bacterium]
MAKFNFNLRTPGADQPTPINFVVRYAGLRLVFATGETIHPNQWSTSQQKGKGRQSLDLNARLDDLKNTAGKILSNYQLNHAAPPAPAELRNLLNAHLNPAPVAVVKAVDLFDFIDDYIRDAEQRANEKTGRPIHPGTLRTYRQVLKYLREYREKQYRKRPFGFEQIDADLTGFYQSFRNYLTKDRKFSSNTVGQRLGKMKTFLIEAQARGLLKNFNPRRFKVISEDTDAIHLNETELENLRALDLSQNPRLDRVRDLFLVGCWSGLRFSDFTRIRRENFTPDGRFIDLSQQKTGDRVKFPINSAIRAVMGKYEGHTPNGLPPALSNVKMNLYLKELGQLAGLDTPVMVNRTKGGMLTTRTVPKYELLVTHTARRSFATNMIQRNYPVQLVMAITGHKTEAMFWKYVKLTRSDRAELFRQLLEQDEEARPLFKVA